MMQLGRVIVRPDRVSVTRPGYDVRYAPRTPDYMAVDSSFPASQRLRMSGVVWNASARSQITIGYGTSYPDIPVVELVPMSGNRSILPMVIGDSAQTRTTRSQPYLIGMYRDRFTFMIQNGNSVWADYVFNWVYYVWGP